MQEILAGGIRNLGKCASGIQNPRSTDKGWNPVPGIWKPRRGIQNPRLSWIPLYGAIKRLKALKQRNYLTNTVTW